MQNSSSNVFETPQVDSQLDAIRAAVRRAGSATIRHDVLTLLCPDYLSVSEQFQRIAEFAKSEGWRFAFLTDGAVRFRSFAPAP